MKKVSFVIPAYNAAAWLAHAVESCQKQDYPLIEIVVVDDCSTDSTKDLMGFLCAKDKRIVYVNTGKNSGRSWARNVGNETASGGIICVLDADDIAYPNRAKLTVEKMKTADFVYGSMDVIDALGSKVGVFQADVFNKKQALETKLNRIVHSSVAYTKDLALKFPYQEGEVSGLGIDDWQMQTAVAMAGERMDFISQTIGAYRILQTAVTKTRDEAKVHEVKDKILSGFAVAL